MLALTQLQQRNLIHQFTGQTLEEILAKPRVAYLGMDPTAPAIHAGYLIPITVCSILRQHGFKIIVLLGGATAMIGDPTGKSAQRKMLSEEQIQTNMDSLKANIAKFFPDSTIVNNRDWLGELDLMSFLSDYARYVSVNGLIKLESFEKRLNNEQSLSVLEIFYPILQGYDFYYLNKHYNCTLQLGGSDQWANILYGVDLVKRLSNEVVYGMTCPLMLNHAGDKMGKTAQGAVWLDETLCSVFDFWQYWRNLSDEDVIKFAQILLGLEYNQQDINAFKKLFATQMTSLVHGNEKAEQAQAQAVQMFEQRNFDVTDTYNAQNDERLCDILVALNWAKSNSEAKQLIKAGSVTVDGEKILDPVYVPTAEVVLCKSKKHFCKIVK